LRGVAAAVGRRLIDGRVGLFAHALAVHEHAVEARVARVVREARPAQIAWSSGVSGVPTIDTSHRQERERSEQSTHHWQTPITLTARPPVVFAATHFGADCGQSELVAHRKSPLGHELAHVGYVAGAMFAVGGQPWIATLGAQQ
jgi:hypothetical protein